MESFVNALNRHEYLRAYSYWESGAPRLQPFPEFEQGYADTQSVRLTLGTAYEDAGAGNYFMSVPALMVAQTTGGDLQTFVGCYVLHLASPGIQGTPPFQPLAIQSAQVAQVANDADPGSLLAQACGQAAGSPVPTSSGDPADVGADRYLDDRSTAETLMRSFVNALNRHEYLRAYSYWEPEAPGLAPYPQFEAGYADTESVQATIGQMSSDAGAGQVYHVVPVTLISKRTSGETQTFVGCYVLHLSSPSIQDTPPFRGLEIQSADVKQVADDADAAQLMNEECAASSP